MIEVNTNNAAVKTSGIYSNPLGAINRSWNEAVMNASMESVLTGFGDPRIAKFSNPAPRISLLRMTAGNPFPFR